MNRRKGNHRQLLILAIVAVSAAVGIAIWKRGQGERDALPRVQSVAQGAEKNQNSTGGKAVRQLPKEKLPEIDPAKTSEAIQEEIGDLSSQYSPEAVKPLAAYLYHSDPEVREAARQGLMQLSESSAVPYLREAAKSELNPDEAKKFDEAADFLLLPEGKIEPKKKAR